jgi:uncharacterized protein YneF (UPF0154 family)
MSREWAIAILWYLIGFPVGLIFGYWFWPHVKRKAESEDV